MLPPLPPPDAPVRPPADRLSPSGPTSTVQGRFACSVAFGQQLVASVRRGASFRHLLVWCFVGWCALVNATAQDKVDLSLGQTLSNKTPALGDVLTYTLTLRNTGAVAADSVEVTGWLPEGVEYVDAEILRGSQSWQHSDGTGLWKLGTLTAGDSAVVQVRARVTQPGVWFSTAFVSKQQQPDADSTPGNESLIEDDHSTACFSVPVALYPDEELTVKIPLGYKGVVWFRNDVPISANTSDAVAVINADSSLTIRAPGTYRFTTLVGDCPTGGCCALMVVPGPYGSIGDLVFRDVNKDGIQNDGNQGIAGVTVRLLDSTGTQTLRTLLTDSTGHYRFDSLAKGHYAVEFVKPAGFSAVAAKLGSDPTQDSDADSTTGRTGVVFIDPDLAEADPGRHNPTVDAGFAPVVVCEKPSLLADLSAQTLCAGDTTNLATFSVRLGIPDSLVTYQWHAATATRGVLGSPIAGATSATFRPTGGQLPAADGQPHFYTVIARRGAANCSDTLLVSLTINAVPAAPAVAPVPLACAGSPVSLVATSVGNSIRWFASSTAATPLATTESGNPYDVTADSSRTYYAQAVNAAGCAGPRVAVFVGVNPKPAKPTGLTALANACPDSTVNLAAALRTLTPSVAGGTFEWHLGPLNTSALVVDSLGTKTLTMYLFEKSPEGCYSDPQAVTVTITKCGCSIPVAVTLTAPGSVCGTGPIAASALVDAGGRALSGLWSSTGSGMFSTVNGLTTTYTPSKADSASGKVTLTFTTLDPDGSGVCQAVSQSSVVKLNVIPSFLAVRADTALCGGDSLLLTASVTAGATVKWYSAASGGTLLGTGGNLSVKPSKTTTYYAEATSADCTNPERKAVKITVNECVPKIDLSLVKTVSNASPFVGDTVTYTLEVRNAGPNPATSIQVRDVIPAGLQALSWAGMTKAGDTLTASFASLAVEGVQRFTYRAKVTGEGTITNRAQITAATEPDEDSTPNNGTANNEDDQAAATLRATKPCLAKVPELSATKTTVAAKECLTLTATGCANGTVTWTAPGQPSHTGLTLQLCPAETVTYTATCTVDGCTSQPSKPLTITVFSADAPVVKASTTAVCGSPVTLTAAGCDLGKLIWSHDPAATGDSLVVSLTKTTTFTAVCKTGDYTSPTSNAVTVEVARPMIPVIGAISTEICPGGSTVLAAYGCESGKVVWSDGQEGLTVTVSPTVAKTYFAQCKIGDCVSGKSNELTINVLQGVTPVVSASATSLCYGATVTLTAVGCSGGVQWSNGMTGFKIEVNTPGSYAAKCVGTGCAGEFSKPVVIKEGEAPAAPKLLASQSVICVGESVTLTATGCEKGLIAWNTGKTGPSLTVSLTETSVFTATCTLNSCTSAPSVADTVRVNNPTTPGIAASKTSIMAGDSVVLSATGCNGTVHWSNGMTGLQITVKPRVDTTFFATCRVGSCESPQSNEIKITVKCAEPPAAPVLTATKTTVLRGTSTVLTAKGCDNGIISWRTADTRPFDPAQGVGGKLSGASQHILTVTPSVATTFLAVCTVEGCSSPASDSLTIHVEDCADLKAPIVVASSKLICAGTPVTLSVAGCENGRVLWNTGDTTRTLTVSPLLTSTFSAQCRVGNCTSPISNDETVSVVTPLVPTVTADSLRIQPGSSVTLLARGCNGTVIWSNGGIGASITVQLTADSTFTARCVVGQCTGVASKPVTIKVGNEPVCPAPQISADKTTVCAGGSVVLTATGCTGTVTWNGTQTGSPLTVSLTQTTTYRATCTLDGCTSPASDSLVVVVETVPAPVRSAASLTNACPAKTVNLTAAVEAPASGTVEFYTGTTIGSPKVAKPDSVIAGTYYAFVKSASGCYGEPLQLVASVVSCDTAKKVLSLGIAKQVVGTPTELAAKVFAITYEFRAKNLGTVGFEKLRLRDDLKAAFALKGAVVDSLTLTADAGLTINPSYTGEGVHTDLLVDSLSTLPAGTTRWVRLTMRVNLTSATDSVFHNTAIGTGWAADGSSLEDASTVGVDPDPDNDDDPNNNSVPTPVTLRLEAIPLQATIGLAMHADTARQADGSYRIIYTLTLKNYGDQPATRIQVTDSLSRVFTGAASYTVVDKPGGLAEGSTLTPNPNFDGRTDANLLIADRSSLPARQSETFRFTVLVVPDGRTEPFLNTALATARYGDLDEVFDYSTNGFNPAPDGVPALAFAPTPVTLPSNDDGKVFIPEGFSPNGDGVNDVFRIRNTAGATVHLQVFNRWGQLVYGNEDYRNDWDGKSNRGSAFGLNGLPDGTYYYVVKLSDGRQFARYLTLMR